MFHLIPPPLHRLALRVAYRVRHVFRAIVRPRLRGAGVVIYDGQGQVLLVRHSYGSGAWSLPGGGCGRSEDPADCARREVREELGLGLADVELLSTIEEKISGAPHTAFVFAARADGAARPDQREIVEAKFFAHDALPEHLGPLTAERVALWLDRAGGYSSES